MKTITIAALLMLSAGCTYTVRRGLIAGGPEAAAEFIENVESRDTCRVADSTFHFYLIKCR